MKPSNKHAAPKGSPHKAPKFTDLRVTFGASVADAKLPKASIVILNLNGAHHLERCFESLSALDYPKDKVDVQLIDNASDDGSVEQCKKRWPWVRVTVNAKNEGFSRACNQGARLRGDAGVVVFLNNDMRVDKRWLRELVQPIARGECAATTAKMFSWDGKHIDSAAGGMNFHGIGLQYGYKETPAPEHDMPRKTLFACGGAMAIDGKVFDDVGGFDNEFFAYYEDVDLGWRMWVLGHEVHYVPAAFCWHHHSSTSKTLPPETLRLLHVRNPLLSCFKNYDDDDLRRVLPSALALAVRRMLIMTGIESDEPFRIEHARPRAKPGPPDLLDRALAKIGKKKPMAHGHIAISRFAAADLIGINDLLSNWQHWMGRRAEVQSRRKRPDAEIFRLFLRPLWCIERDPAYRELHEGIASFSGVRELFEGLTLIDKDPHG